MDEIHAKLLPQDKVSELQKIRQDSGAVMFVGDGINDAPVLAGADVGALAERSEKDAYDDASDELPAGHVLQKGHFTFLRGLPFPVVSVVTGFCIGSGSEIAVNSHYRILEKGARIGQPESTFGILPALGGVARNIEICGMKNPITDATRFHVR